MPMIKGSTQGKPGAYSSDGYTSGTMRRLMQLEAGSDMANGPNSTPAGALQKRKPRDAMGSDATGSTPNSTRQGSLQKTSQAHGQPPISYPGTNIPAVMDYGGIPHRPDPNLGGAGQLTTKNRGTGY